MASSRLKVTVFLLLSLYIGGYVKEGAFLVLGGFLIFAIFFIVGMGLTYTRALTKGRNSCFMSLVGRHRCMSFMSCLFSRPVSSSRTQRQAQAQISLVRNDPIARAKNGYRICLIGTSAFTYWEDVKTDLKPFNVFNAAFGGSRTSDLLPHTKPLVTEWTPSMICYYSGSTDLLHNGGTPDCAFHGFQEFVKRVRITLPKCTIVYVCPLLAPIHFFRNTDQKIDELIQLASEWCTNEKYIYIINPNATIMNKDSEWTSSTKYYLNDGLHLTKEGHRMLGRAMLPIMTAAWNVSKDNGGDKGKVE